MKKIKVCATSDTSWLDAARQLIVSAQLRNENIRSLSIKEDRKAIAGKYCLKTKLAV